MNFNVDLNRISLFLEIVKTGSITKTAEVFNLQKSKVSRDLALLEKELGTQLIYRTTRQFNLTVEGQRFYEKAKKSIEVLEDTINETSKEAKSIAGHISITSPEDIGEIILIPLLEEFSKIYPKITYSIQFSTEILDLVANKIDLAIRPGHLKDSSLKMKKAGLIKLGLYCSETLYNSLPNLNSPDQLSSVSTIYFERGEKQPAWDLENQKSKRKIFIQPFVKVNSYTAALKMVSSGMGVGLLPNFILKNQGPRSSIIQVLKEWTTKSYNLHLVYPHRNEDIARVRVLIDFLTKKMSTVL